jgi:hypothetical protein
MAAKPWDRIPGEPERAFKYFREYLTLPPLARNIPTYCAQYSRRPSYMGNLCSLHRWIERARAFDAYQQDQIDREVARKMGDVAADQAEKLVRREAEYIDACWDVFKQAYRRFRSLKRKARKAAKTNNLSLHPTAEEWSAAESSVVRTAPLAERSLVRMRAAAGPDEDPAADLDADTVAAALKAASEAAGRAGPTDDA